MTLLSVTEGDCRILRFAQDDISVLGVLCERGGEIERSIVALSSRRARRYKHGVSLIFAPGQKGDVCRIGNAQQIEQDVVGAVARDVHGDVSAGTSTGGMQGKLPGRVGDSPVIGAGTYAANDACAVSATGVGEYFIRLDAAKEICALVKMKGITTSAAAEQVIRGEVAKLKGGEGGVIVLDQKSDPVWSYNTLGMFRARQVEGGTAEVEVK